MKLTPEILLTLGFMPVEPDNYRGKASYFRFTPPKHKTRGYYVRDIQVSIGEYPDTNPNSGIVSVYFPEQKIKSVQDEPIGSNPSVLDVVESDDSVRQYGYKWVTVGPHETPIAYYVTTLGRLNAIYTALTDNEPFVYPGFNEATQSATRLEQPR